MPKWFHLEENATLLGLTHIKNGLPRKQLQAKRNKDLFPWYL